MTVFTVRNLSIQFQGNSVFEDACSVLSVGKNVGIVGPNGSGKTTLLRSILGDLQPDSGSVDWIRSPRTAYVPQKWEPDPTITPMDFVGYEKADALGRCGIGRALWDQPCESLSGGERTRVLIARALSIDPEVLVLDEPTNHLDIPGIEWLEKTLKAFKGSVLVVSHDRFFLDAVATEIWELRDNRLTTFSGGYSQYRSRLREQEAAEAREYAKWQHRVRELTTEVADRRQWYEKAHDDAGKNDFYRRKAKKHARQFKAKETVLARTMAGEPEIRRADRALSVRVDHAGHRTRTILRTSLLGFAYKDKARAILEGVSVSLAPSEKVGLIGPNGSGKTTLIRLLLGELEPLAGTVWVNPRVRIGYLSQTLSELDPERTTADNVRDRTGLTMPEARNLLGKMGLVGDTQLQSIGTLSMGERTRVAVSCLCFGSYDALILDEPTNHLDATARDCVEQALSSFPGALLAATHDRYFMDRVCNTVWSLEDGKIRTVKGNYSAFRDDRMAVPSQTGVASPAGRPDPAMVELALQTELAFTVSRITAAKSAKEKESLERTYSSTLERLKELRSEKARSAGRK